MKFKNFLSDLNGKDFTKKDISDDGKIKISCTCDGAFSFLYQLVSDLTIMGCTDIEVESREATEDEIPKEKPWRCWYFSASGILPKTENDG